jgi:hypothetical protein
LDVVSWLDVGPLFFVPPFLPFWMNVCSFIKLGRVVSLELLEAHCGCTKKNLAAIS